MAAQACLNEQVLLTFDFFPGQQDPRSHELASRSRRRRREQVYEVTDF